MKNFRLTMVFSVTMIVFLNGGTLFAQKIVQIESPNLAMEEENLDADRNSGIIFSNLGPTASDRYDSRTFAKLTVAGKGSIVEPETWVAVNFIPKRDVQAQVLLAAITYVSGTRLVNLGLYSDDDGQVGDPIPGAQGSTAQIPDSGECCQLARVTLSAGVMLAGGTRYWLVASPDNVNGANFTGSWQVSNEGMSAQGAAPPAQWATGSGGWPAAEVRGTVIAGSVQPEETTFDGAGTNRITIFNNLVSTPTQALLSDGRGMFVAGQSVDGASEA